MNFDQLLKGTQISDIEAKLGKCLIFKVTFHSIITETAPGYGYRYELLAELKLKRATGTRATGSAPLQYVEASWTAGGPCGFAASGTGSTFDAQGAGNGLSISPVSRTSPAVNITLQYDPGVPAEHTTITCPGTPPVMAPSRARPWMGPVTHASPTMLPIRPDAGIILLPGSGNHDSSSTKFGARCGSITLPSPERVLSARPNTTQGGGRMIRAAMGPRRYWPSKKR
jgi:hypothetical protein